MALSQGLRTQARFELAAITIGESHQKQGRSTRAPMIAGKLPLRSPILYQNTGTMRSPTHVRVKSHHRGFIFASLAIKSKFKKGTNANQANSSFSCWAMMNKHTAQTMYIVMPAWSINGFSANRARKLFILGNTRMKRAGIQMV